ncbi:MAG: PAS domain S-box protein [Promethearchaeota archaeon]|nr:MAG: PAS domain S-box protein [Candidatus Lokiarchaeota archaeon]
MTKEIFLENYNLVINQSPISIILLNFNGKIIDINKVAENTLDLVREEIINNYIDNVISFSNNPFNELLSKVKERQEKFSYGPAYFEFLTKTKQRKQAKFILSSIEIEEKYYLQVFITSIKLQQTMELGTKNSAPEYKILAESAGDLITVVNSEFLIEYVNTPVHESLMGYSEKDLLNTNPMNLIHPQDREIVLGAFKDVLKKGKGRIISRIKHNNGHYIWFESNGRIFQDRDGKDMIMIISRDITNRIEYEKKLKESQQRYRDLANTLPEVIFELDLHYNLIYTNLVASKVFGYSHEDFIKGLTVFDFIHPEDKDETLYFLKRLYNGEQADPETIRLRKKDGSYIYTRVFASPIIKNAQVVGVRSIIHDITEMVKAQEKIEESETKFRSIAEQSLLGICIIQDQRIKYINQVLVKILGYSKEEIKNWKSGEFFKTIHPSDKKMIIELATAPDEKFKDGIRSYEARGIQKSGKIIWLDVFYKRIKYKEKPAFLISFLDISEKKEARQKLQESEEKHRFLFKNAPFGIILIDRAGKIKDCNPAVENLIGYQRNEIIGKKYHKLLVVKEEQLPVLLERLTKIGKGESMPPLDVQLERKDHSHIWVNIESSLMKVGNDVFIIVMGHDISEKKEAEQKLRELDALRKEFIDRASHELKTPITTIYGAYQLLNTHYRDRFEKEELELLEMAFTGTKRLKKLVDDLLDVSKIESKMFKLELEPINLSGIVKKSISELRYLIKQKDQKLELDLPEKLTIIADASRIELVVTNVLSNSIKYTPVNGRIWIVLKKINSMVELSIRDSGIGLSQDEINQLFQKFTKIANPQEDQLGLNFGSTGLGLYIVYQIVRLHEGKLTAESPGKNKGSTFTIKLPIKHS